MTTTFNCDLNLSTYTIEEYPLGKVIRGSVPVEELLALMKVWKKKKLDWIDIKLASALEASLVITSKNNYETWRAQVLSKPNLKDPIEKRLEDWLHSGEVGTSALTIASIMIGRNIRNVKYDHPYDQDDLERCRFLLSFFPEWKKRIGELQDLNGWKDWIEKL
jgi:hypothetical protein